LKLSDLSPSVLASSLRHQYFTTSGHLMQYYSNLRVVYEIESRLNEMRRDTSTPAAKPATQQQQEKAKPQAQPSSGKPGGSARKSGSGTPAEQRHSAYVAPIPVLALLHPQQKIKPGPRLRFRLWTHSRIFSSGSPFLFERPGNHHKPLERSLV